MAVAALAATTVVVAGSGAPVKKNVLFVMADDMRPELAGAAYGSSRMETLKINRRAHRRSTTTQKNASWHRMPILPATPMPQCRYATEAGVEVGRGYREGQ